MVAESASGRRAGAVRPGRSNRTPIAGQRGPRQAVARPASTIAAAPASTAARQGAPARITRPGPAMTTACTAPPPDEPPVVEPPSGPSRALARAAASTADVRTAAAAATAAPAPSTAIRTPKARLITDLVAITAARQASAASPSAPASGTSCWPVTEMSWTGSGLGGVKTARAHAWRRASTTRPAPAAPASSTRVNSLRIFQQHVRVEAGPVAGVAGPVDLVDLYHEGVAVAVERHRLDPLVVPRRVALHPVLLAAARPVGAPARGEGAMQRLVVHPAEHQHFAGVVLLGDRRDQAGCVSLQPCRDGRVKHRSSPPEGTSDSVATRLGSGGELRHRRAPRAVRAARQDGPGRADAVRRLDHRRHGRAPGAARAAPGRGGRGGGRPAGRVHGPRAAAAQGPDPLPRPGAHDPLRAA